MWESNNAKLLVMTNDDKLTFDSHFKDNQKVSVLNRLTSLLTFDKKRILFKAFFGSQSKYCPWTWT